MDIANAVKFRDICAMLERVKKAPKPDAKEKILRRYYESFQKFRQAFRKEQNIGATSEEDGNSSFYCVLRCLIPHADNTRKPYGLQVNSLGNVYIKVLQLPDDSREAERLKACRYSSTHRDYADIVHSVLEPRSQLEPSNLSMKDIHDMLDTIAADDRRNTEKVLTKLSESACADEQMWFIRLLLRSMRLGIGEQRIFALLHPQAQELYRRCSNLSRISCLLADNKLDVNALADESKQIDLNDVIAPFQHVRPMLCEVFGGNIRPLMEDDVLYLETKMDGERFQLHYADGRFKYISRNGVDYTYSFGESYSCEGAQLTPQLEHLLPIGLQSIILDGEMMVYDREQKRFRDKGENTDVKHLSGRSSWQPCFVVYDVLYFNGKTLLDMPYVQRLHKLSELLKEEPGTFQIMKPIKVTSMEHFQKLFQQALNENEEGVVLKKQSSVYRPGLRNGGGWYKVKADYIAGLTTEFDLLIIGGFYNRAQTFIHSFLLGVLKYTSPQKFEVYSVGKVANNIRQRVVLNDTLKPHWHQVANEPPPLWYNYVQKSAEGRPDVWIEPKHSSIVQIKAADLAPSSAYRLQKALHFPRIEAWRNDKVWNECMSLSEYLQMCQSNKGIKKINKRELQPEDFTSAPKKAKLTVAQKRKIGMQAYEKKFNPFDIDQSSNLFSNFSFCILSGSPQEGLYPEDVKKLVVSCGGEIVENPIEDAKCICIAAELTFRVQKLIKSGRYNIAKLAWLMKACEQQQMRFRPKDMLANTEDVRAQLAEMYDRFGDAYAESTTMEDLTEVVDDMSAEELTKADASDVEQLEQLLYSSRTPEFFGNIYGCFYADDRRAQLARITFRWRGGICMDITHVAERKKVAYIFVNVECLQKAALQKWLKEHFQQYLQNLKVVNLDWILNSHCAKRKLDVLEYTWHDF